MRYNNEQLQRIKEKEILLSGEVQKAVWSVVRTEGLVRIKHIAVKLGRGSDQVYNVIQMLIEYGLVDKVSRGVYKVSDCIMMEDKKC